MATFREYWRPIHLQAVRETREALSIETRERLVIAIILWVIAIIGVWYVGDRADATSELVIHAAGLAALILGFPVVYAIKLASIPPRLATIATDSPTDLVRLAINEAAITAQHSDVLGVKVSLSNPGAPTVLLNWRATCSVENGTQNFRVLDFHTDRNTTVMTQPTLPVSESYDKYGNYIGKLVPTMVPENLADNPLEQGGYRTGYIRILAPRGVQPAMPGTRLDLTVEDVQGRVIRASHVF